MEIKDVADAGHKALEHLQQNGYEVIRANWINEHRNIFYETRKDGDDYYFYLKFDSAPYRAISYELPEDKRFQGPGVCINQFIYERYIEKYQATILYALPAQFFFISFDNFRLTMVDHIQNVNKEPVFAAPLTEFSDWMGSLK